MIWIAAITATACQILANAIPAGPASSAISNNAILDATNTASARTGLVFASQDGMGNTAQWRAAPTAVLHMVSVVSTPILCGNAAVITAGMVPTVAFYLNKTVTTVAITIKVITSIAKTAKVVTFFCLDGLVDCEDPECCSNRLCSSSQLCVSSPKPIDILLRKQPPAITASFFERMKFLIDEGSLQNYARQETFNERYVDLL